MDTNHNGFDRVVDVVTFLEEVVAPSIAGRVREDIFSFTSFSRNAENMLDRKISSCSSASGVVTGTESDLSAIAGAIDGRAGAEGELAIEMMKECPPDVAEGTVALCKVLGDRGEHVTLNCFMEPSLFAEVNDTEARQYSHYLMALGMAGLLCRTLGVKFCLTTEKNFRQWLVGRNATNKTAGEYAEWTAKCGVKC